MHLTQLDFLLSNYPGGCVAGPLKFLNCPFKSLASAQRFWNAMFAYFVCDVVINQWQISRFLVIDPDNWACQGVQEHSDYNQAGIWCLCRSNKERPKNCLLPSWKIKSVSMWTDNSHVLQEKNYSSGREVRDSFSYLNYRETCIIFYMQYCDYNQMMWLAH